MNVTIKSVLVSDDADEVCLKILKENGTTVDFKAKLEEDEFVQIIPNYNGLFVRSATKVTSRIIEAGNNLRIIGRAGVGVHHIDLEAAFENDVIVLNTPCGNTRSACELACAMRVELFSNTYNVNNAVEEGNWDRPKFVGVHGKTLAIVDLGNFGREVAIRMQTFGMRTIGYDPVITKDQAAEFGVELMKLGEIWPLADYITVHVPLTPANMINKDVFMNKCKKDVCVINCARGGIINEDDLLWPVNEDHCGGAGLDVFTEDPPKTGLLSALCVGFMSNDQQKNAKLISDTSIARQSKIEVKTMPDDIWIMILKYFAKEPVLFNLYNVRSQSTRVMDNYFRKSIILDLSKYNNSNKNTSIDEQVNYVMDYSWEFQHKITEADLTNVLTASRNTLVSLNLEYVRTSRENTTKDTITSFVFPNLKYINVANVQFGGVIDLKESLMLESITVSKLHPACTNFDVVGPDFRIHRCTKDVKAYCDSFNFDSFSMPDACLDNLKSLELRWCKDVSSITTVLERVAFGCDQLEYFGLGYEIRDYMIRELLSQIPKVIANNKKLRKFGFWHNQKLLHSVIQSIIDTKNEHLECIEFMYSNSCTADEIGNDLLDTLYELGYERSNKLEIKVRYHKVSDDVAASLLSQFNVDFHSFWE